MEMIRPPMLLPPMEEATMNKPGSLEDGWLKRSIDEATEFVDRNRDWADAISANWQDDEVPNPEGEQSELQDCLSLKALSSEA